MSDYQTPAPGAGMDDFFLARGIAVIGASAEATKIGGRPVHLLRRHGYAGAIYPINPKGGEIQGLPAYARLADTPTAPELALIAVPASHAVQAVQDRIEESIREIAAGIGIANGVTATVDYQRYYPATINDAEAAQEAFDAAATVGNALVAPDPAFTSEDFAFMLQACQGAYIWLGQAKGDGGTPLHNPHYDFNDDVLALGIKLHVALAERHLAR